MEDYKPNSYKYKREQQSSEKRSVSKVIDGTAKLKKKSEVRKFADVFISEDISNVKNYVVMDVLIPALKKAVSDIVTNGIDMILYGESGRNKRSSDASRVSYKSYYDRPVTREMMPVRTAYDCGTVTVPTRVEAERIIIGMDDIMEEYHLVRVADLYELAGITSNYTDNNWGWTDIRSARIDPVRDGYMIRMPRALPLD